MNIKKKKKKTSGCKLFCNFKGMGSEIHLAESKQHNDVFITCHHKIAAPPDRPSTNYLLSPHNNSAWQIAFIVDVYASHSNCETAAGLGSSQFFLRDLKNDSEYFLWEILGWEAKYKNIYSQIALILPGKIDIVWKNYEKCKNRIVFKLNAATVFASV